MAGGSFDAISSWGAQALVKKLANSLPKVSVFCLIGGLYIESYLNQIPF